MENQELIKQVTEKAQRWLTPAYDAETQAEVKRMLENEDKTELIDCFYKDLERVVCAVLWAQEPIV
jgi:phosphoglucomutase